MQIQLIYFLFGSIFGSFLNALIYRLPRNISMSKSRSFCPSCNNQIPWFCNIPVFSYIFLLGKCFKCKVKIPIKYLLIELFVGVMSLYLGNKYNPLFSQMGLINFLFYFSIVCAFTAHFFIDLEHKILPDSINLYLALLFLIYSFFFKDWKLMLFGAAIGFGFTYSVTWIFYKLRGKIGLGGGDIKLYTVLGLYLGPLLIIENIFLSCFLGALIGVSLIYSKVIDRNTPIPFGPFIIVVGFAQIIFPKYYQIVSNLFKYQV